MNNINEFKKLFKVTIPVNEHHKYYIDTLMKSEFYAGLGKKVEEFEALEEYAKELGFESVKKYKMAILDTLALYLKGTDAYMALINYDYENKKLRTKNTLQENDNTYLISIDFRAANYHALKTFDGNGALYDSWEELCNEMDVHPTLAGSKSFRQVVFGNTSPKRLQRVQHEGIITIIDKLIEDHGFEEDDFVFISHDEFIVRLRPDHQLAVNRVFLLNSAVGNIIQSEGIDMPTHFKVLKNEILKKDIWIQTHYQLKMGGISEKYDVLFNVPGNKFFKYFKKYILKEPLTNLSNVLLPEPLGPTIPTRSPRRIRVESPCTIQSSP